MTRKFFFTITLCILISFGFVFSANVSKLDRKTRFNAEWKFSKEDNAENSKPELNDNNWRSLDLPHDWSIEGQSARDAISGGDGGFFPTGSAWYRKTFFVPTDLQSKKISIYFEGVYMNAELFVNGKSLGIQPYGYTSFEIDLTPHLKYGAQNVLAVKVDNSQQKNCRWYTGSGIYRNVWLKVTEETYLQDWGLYITTPKVNKDESIVKVESKLMYPKKAKGKIDLQVQIFDAKGNLVTQKISKNITKRLTDSIQNITELKITDPILWSYENPYLYNVEISAIQSKKIIDRIVQPLGVRTISYSVEKGFELNGHKVLLNGGCVHHDNGALGAAAFDQAEVRKVKLLKQAGFNSVRTSHNPPSEAFLNACDSLGLLVIDEIFDGWKSGKNSYDYSILFDRWWKHDVDSWVLRDRNHPSIIMWSIGNEIIERKSPEAVKTAKMLSHAVKQNDPSRPVTSAMTTWDNTWEIYDSLMAEHDIAGYNYQLHHAEKDHERVPSRIILQTESYPKDAFFCWNLVKKHNYIIGDFVWTAMDYLGESGIGRYYYPGEPDGEHWSGNLFPWHGAYCGDIDLLGNQKPISHYRNILYNDTEKLYMAVREPHPSNGKIKTTMWAVWPTWESWTWPGYEGENIEVEVYSKFSNVRLYLNDSLIADKPTTINEEFKAVFSVPYSIGELKAVGVNNGVEIESKVLYTAGSLAGINMQADKKEIKSDGQDLIYVDVDLVDANGVILPNAQDEVKFSIEGPAIIVAVSNANLKDSDLYVANQRKAWKGKLQVILKSKSIGNIKLKAIVEGLQTKELSLKSY